MSATPRPFTGSRTYLAATTVDPEPHVLTITVHAPQTIWDFSTPRRTAWSATWASLRDAAHEKYQDLTGRSRGFHFVGHVMIELKSVDSQTGKQRYLLTSVSDQDSSETFNLMFREQIGYALLQQGVSGRLQTADEVGQDIDEAAELNIRSARFRVLLSREAAERMFEFYDEFEKRGVYRRFALQSYPLRGEGAGCTSLAAGFLEVAGLLEPAWKSEWERCFRVPESLFGKPCEGERVPPRMLLLGASGKQWADVQEPHRVVAFYDTTSMYNWVIRYACLPRRDLPMGYSNSTPLDQTLSRFLNMHLVTIDRKNCKPPTGKIFPEVPLSMK